MSEWRTINLNDRIRFKLTERGKEIYRAYWQPYYGDRDPLEHLPADADGWREEQLWYFANVFGQHFENGLNPPVETMIQVRA